MAPGTYVKFKIEATGDDLKFQWQKNRNIDLSDDEKYCDTDTDTLHIVEVEKGDKGRYRCCVSNYIGETFSEEAFLTVGTLIIHAVMCFAYFAVKPTLSFPMCGVGYEIHVNFVYDVGCKILILFLRWLFEADKPGNPGDRLFAFLIC